MLGLQSFLIFTITIYLSHFPLQGQGRYVHDPEISESSPPQLGFSSSLVDLGKLGLKRTNEHSRQFEAASLKRVLQYYKSVPQDAPEAEESIESDSIEVNSLHRLPSYRIALDSKEEETSTDNAIIPGSGSVEDDPALASDVKVVTTVSSLSVDPEEAEIETTTLFPVEKMEEFGVVDSSKLKVAAENHHDDSDDDIVEHREGADTLIEEVEVNNNASSSTSISSSSSTPAPTPTSAPLSQEPCVEGDVRQEGCNMCICISGSFFCSKRTCSASENAAGGKPPVIKKKVPAKQSVAAAATHGTPFISSDNENESEGDKDSDSEESIQGNGVSSPTFSTTTKATTTTTPKPECTGGVTKSIDCNLCVCSPSGKWACTKRSCIALTLREKASYTDGSFMNKTETLLENPYIDEDCSEGESRNWGCNSCVCFMNSWSCTDQKCPPTTQPPKKVNEMAVETCHTEHDIKSVECNVCHCTRGVWVCSRNDCKRFGQHRYELQTRSKFRFRSSQEQ